MPPFPAESLRGVTSSATGDGSHLSGIQRHKLATAILLPYATTQALGTILVQKLAELSYDGRRRIGDDLAGALIEAAKTSVGHFSCEPDQLQVRYACEDIVSLRTRVGGLETDIELRLKKQEVGKLLTTIPRVSRLTAARMIAETGDPARFRSAAAFGSYIGAVPTCPWTLSEHRVSLAAASS